MNNNERELWVLNDEGLYNWWKSSHQSISKFIRANRAEIDQYITRTVNKEVDKRLLMVTR